MKSYRGKRYSFSSRRSFFARVGDWLASARIRRRKPYVVARRRRPWPARLTDACSCLAERLDTRWTRAAGKMALAAVAVLMFTMIVGNSLQRSLSGDIRRLSLEKQQQEKQHVLIQAELTDLVKKNKDRLGLAEGKPGQLIQMN